MRRLVTAEDLVEWLNEIARLQEQWFKQRDTTTRILLFERKQFLVELRRQDENDRDVEWNNFKRLIHEDICDRLMMEGDEIDEMMSRVVGGFVLRALTKIGRA